MEDLQKKKKKSEIRSAWQASSKIHNLYLKSMKYLLIIVYFILISLKLYYTTFEMKNLFFYELTISKRFLLHVSEKKTMHQNIIQIVKSDVKGKKCVSFNYCCLFLDSRNLWFFFTLTFFYFFFFFDGCLIYPVFATSQEEIQVVCVSLEVDFLPSGIK